ncbi:MAG: succinylglutamate desuccinylase/aspartoacylase family protein [Patescibacteria group bacterium]
MAKKKSMTYLELIAGYRDKGYKLRSYGLVREKRIKYRWRRNLKEYRLFKIVINPRYRKTLIITSGFHGEEFNGPISLLEIFDEIVRYARKKRVRLIVYPCVNPSGFDLHKRYNASSSSKQYNNDFLRYKIRSGRWVGTLKPLKHGEIFFSIKIVDSRAKEVRLLKRDVLKYRVPQGILDIHQQKGNLDTGDFYAYIFDKKRTYQKIMKKLKRIAKVAKNDPAMNFEDGRKVYYKIDSSGFIKLHDGTLTDMFYRLGSEFVITAETSTKLPLGKVCQINLIWAKELIKLISKK